MYNSLQAGTGNTSASPTTPSKPDEQVRNKIGISAMAAVIDNAIVVAETAGAETTRQELVLNDMRHVLAKHAVSPPTCKRPCQPFSTALLLPPPTTTSIKPLRHGSASVSNREIEIIYRSSCCR